MQEIGPLGVLTKQEDEIMITWILNMQKVGLFVTLWYLKMKVVEITQTKPTPFRIGVPGNTWWFWF
jgi:hypothetical protein